MRRLFAFALLAAAAAAEPDAPPPARAAHDQGLIAREEGRLADAVQAERTAIEQHPQYWEAHAGYLDALRGLGRVEEARSLYDKLVAEHADSPDMAAFSAAARPPAEAIAALKTVTGAHPECVRAWIELGRAHLLAGDLRAAEDALRDAVKLSPRATIAHVLLGDALMRDGKVSQARKQYEGALELDPMHAGARVRVALTWHRDGKSDRAVEDLARLVLEENLPRYAAAHWALAVVHAERGEIAASLASIERLLAIHPADARAWIVKAQLLLREDKPLEAVAAAKKATEIDAASAEAWFTLGWTHEVSASAPATDDAQRRERLEAAAAAYEQCTRLSPDVRARDSLGFVRLLADRHQDALTEFKRAQDVDPDYAPAFTNHGVALDMSDDRAEAMKRYQLVLSRIDRDNRRARIMLALDQWLQGSAPKAIKDLTAALKDDPQDDLAWTFLGDIYYDMRKVNEAINAYREAVAVNDRNFFAWYHLGLAYELDKRRDEEADAAYRKALAARIDPPPDLLLRLAEVNEEDRLERLDQALQFYKQYRELGGTEAWVADRIQELEEMLAR